MQQKNPLLTLETLGQSIWLDYIKRDLMSSGKLKHLIDEDGLRGMTSNPSLFEKAIAESQEYDQDIQQLVREGKDIKAVYEHLTVADVKEAAREFYPLYQQLKGHDGYVSLEVNPHLAHDTKGTIAEAKHLWQQLNCPNVFIKVPATKEGLVAIKELISEGINVNVTLLFGLPRYQEVAEAYLAGIEARLRAGKPVDQVRSVASFFLSRIDVLIDPILEKIASSEAKALQGQVAIASAKVAYNQIYNKLFNSEHFKKLATQGAKVQRLLWASTSTKNPAYSDTKYVEALIGPETVNTLPMETLEAYLDHGDPKVTLTQELDKALQVFKDLPKFNIDIDKMTQQLEDEGVQKFNKSYDELIETLKKAMSKQAIKE